MSEKKKFVLVEQLPILSELIKWIPQLSKKYKRILYGRLEEGAVCNPDFVITMILSTALATFGLLLNSAAIIIGAMLVAPLMTPLIASGCSLIRGNLALFRESTRTMFWGTVAGLGVSIVIGFLIPKDTLTMELLARSNPNIVDLFVALLAGAAAAYATGRPRVVASLVGVAVAAALVPPLATVGIALTEMQWIVAEGAAVLFITNLVAIILGSAITFNLMGVRGMSEGIASPLWVRRSFIGLILFFVFLIAPLSYRMVDQISEGQIRPHSYPLSPKVSRQIKARVAEEPEVSLLLGGRSGVEYEEHDIILVLYSPKPVSRKFKSDLEEIIKEFRGAHIKVEIVALREGGWTGPEPEKEIKKKRDRFFGLRFWGQ